MPLYIYQHPLSLETVEVFQKMNDKHDYFDGEGLQWRRVYVSPNAFIGSSNKINPFDSKDFVKFTEEKKGTYGQMMELSAELSAKRKDKEGRDAVKEKWLADYKKTNKVDYFDSSKDKVIKKNGVTIDFGAK